MERRGSGFKQIREDYELAANWRAGLEPVFYSDQIGFWVTLYNLNYGCDVELETTQAPDATTQAPDGTTQAQNGTTQASDGTTQASDGTTQESNHINSTSLHLTKTDLMVLSIIKDHPDFSKTEMATILNWKTDLVAYYIKKLKKLGVIERIGSSQKGKWVIL